MTWLTFFMTVNLKHSKVIRKDNYCEFEPVIPLLLTEETALSVDNHIL